MKLNKTQLEQLKQYILIYLLHTEHKTPFKSIQSIEITSAEFRCGDYLSLEFNIIWKLSDLFNNHRTLMIPVEELDIIWDIKQIKITLQKIGK